MFLKESMRMYPPVIASGRQLEKPLKLRSKLNPIPEVEVPTGSILVIHVLALHRNLLVWKDPEVSLSVVDSITRAYLLSLRWKEKVNNFVILRVAAN